MLKLILILSAIVAWLVWILLALALCRIAREADDAAERIYRDIVAEQKREHKHERRDVA